MALLQEISPGLLSGDGLVEAAAETPHVGASSLHSASRLGRDVLRGADVLSVVDDGVARATGEDARAPEVAELVHVLLDDEDVRRLHVAVDDPLLREVLERVQHLLHDESHLARGQRAAALDEVVERAAGTVLHGVAVDAAHVDLVVVEDDVVVEELANDHDFVLDVAEDVDGGRRVVVRGVVAVGRETVVHVVGGIDVELQKDLRARGGFADIKLKVR